MDSEHSQCNDHADCPMSMTLDIIGGKWKVVILHQLRDGTLRFGQLRKQIPNITQKSLSQQLKALEKDGLVEREVYPEVPPRVEYTMTELGRALKPAMRELLEWGKRYKQNL